ncbi:MAG: cytochrome c biogenesis protein CcsA [Blastocatellia bacterium]|nr:cytochrome c biogenesis protein CcsA [Blastocatellia bacterium]
MSSKPVNLEIPFVTQTEKGKGGMGSSESLIFIIPLLVSIGLVLARWKGVAPTILKEGNLTLVSLICYLGASVVFVTFLLGREELLRRIGMWTMALGFILNFTGWGVRWVEITDHFLAQPAAAAAWNSYSLMDKASHTFPLTGLYDVGIGFTSIAVLSALIIGSRPKYHFIGFIVMPIASLVLILVFFLGNEITTLQPILRSYWRPIHVSLAAISYGVCLVSFGVAMLYLLKDNVKIESVGFWVALLGIATYCIIGDFRVLTSGSYGLAVKSMGGTLNLAGGGNLRAELPGVANLMRVGTLLYILAGITLALYVTQGKQQMQIWGNRLMMAAMAGQVAIFGAIWIQIKSITPDLVKHIDPAQYPAFGAWLAKNFLQQDPRMMSTAQLSEQAQQFLSTQASTMSVNFSSNPIEMAAIVTLIAATGFVVLFVLRGKTLLASLPALETLDDLNYKIVSVCFPMLAMMLITGAVWANESWGTYWSWDPKETWALITWLAYAAYLHTRIVHNWKGRSSAYFAVVGFLFVIFTYLGVSFVLPGLHSYAGVN